MDELRHVDIEKVDEDVARISAYFDFMKEHLKIFQKTEWEIKRGKKKVYTQHKWPKDIVSLRNNSEFFSYLFFI